MTGAGGLTPGPVGVPIGVTGVTGKLGLPPWPPTGIRGAICGMGLIGPKVTGGGTIEPGSGGTRAMKGSSRPEASTARWASSASEIARTTRPPVWGPNSAEMAPSAARGRAPSEGMSEPGGAT